MMNKKSELKSTEEQNMVNSIVKYYPKLYKKDDSSKNVAGNSKKCDITLEYENVTYHLEVKHSNKNNNPNYCKQMLAECLYNRKKHEKSSEKRSYGILVDVEGQEKNSVILEMARKNYLEKDWKKFGACFNCKAIFLYNESESKLYFMRWNELFNKNKEPIPIKNN